MSATRIPALTICYERFVLAIVATDSPQTLAEKSRSSLIVVDVRCNQDARSENKQVPSAGLRIREEAIRNDDQGSSLRGTSV